MRRAPLALSLVLLALASGARAQEPEPDAGADEAARALLDRAGSALVTDAWWGLHRAGRNVGALHLVVRAEGDELRASASADVTLGGERVVIEEQATYGPGLRLRALRRTVAEGPPGAAPDEGLDVEPAGEALRVRWRAGPSSGTFVLDARRPLVAGLTGRLLLCQLLARAPADPAGRAPRPPVEVVVAELDEEPPGGVRPLACRVTFAEREPGRARLELAREGEGWTVEVVAGPGGPVLDAIRDAGNPALVHRAAGDEAEARRDRPDAGAPRPGSAAAAALTYLRALARADAAAVAELVDWPALHRALEAEGPVDAFRASFLAGVTESKDEPELDPEQVEDLAGRLKETPGEGGVTWVSAPGDATRLGMSRGAEGAPWRVVAID